MLGFFSYWNKTTEMCCGKLYSNEGWHNLVLYQLTCYLVFHSLVISWVSPHSPSLSKLLQWCWGRVWRILSSGDLWSTATCLWNMIHILFSLMSMCSCYLLLVSLWCRAMCLYLQSLDILTTRTQLHSCTCSVHSQLKVAFKYCSSVSMTLGLWSCNLFLQWWWDHDNKYPVYTRM